jgi:hypothetical protein
VSLCPRFSTVTAICFVLLVPWQGATRAQAVATSDIRRLMAQLTNVRTIGPNTEKQILELAARDVGAREYVVQRLPDMVISGTDEPWICAVRLAGKLKARETIPALLQAMSRPPFPATTYLTFAGVERLDNDIVAKSLAQIGNPAIPSVALLLNSADILTRSRAVLILRNIGSPASRKALLSRRPHETDPEIKKLIDDSLHS